MARMAPPNANEKPARGEDAAKTEALGSWFFRGAVSARNPQKG
jgi:hypothetical protein